MAVIGEATLNIVPKVVGGLANAINGEIDAANLTGAGRRAGSQLSGGFAAGASFAAWSKVASVAIDAVTDSLGSAASRVDTLNNYPRIMESLGVETADAQKSISTMSDELSNVPTKLDDMANTVSGLYAATQKYGTEIGTVTDAGLALNSMLLAGGQNQSIVNAAMEQFRQMVAKGKPDLQDWRSLLSAAPGQMNQLAEAVLGAGASVEDLYAVLGGGKEDEYGGPFEWGSLSMGEFVDKFAELKDKFADDAEDAQGGIQTAFANMQNAVTRGVAGVLDSIGQENIAGAINDVKGWINGIFGVVQDVAGAVTPAVTEVWKAVSGIVDGIGDLGAQIGDGFKYGFGEGWTEGENKVRSLSDAIAEVAGDAAASGYAVDVMGITIEGAADRARSAMEKATAAHGDYIKAVGNAADAIRDADSDYEGTYARLETAMGIIEEYAGKSDLSATKQRELKSAVETVNEQCGTQYQVMQDNKVAIEDESGAVEISTEKIWENVRAREAAAKVESLEKSKVALEEVYAAAALELAEQKKTLDIAQDGVDLLVEKYGSLELAHQAALRGANAALGTQDEKAALATWQAWEKATEGYENAAAAMDEVRNASSDLDTQLLATAKVAEGKDVTLYDLAAASTVAAQALSNDTTRSLSDFAATIDACVADVGDSTDRMRDVIADPQKMAEIVTAYDGTAASVRDVLMSMGIAWNDAAAVSIDSADNMLTVKDKLNDLANEAKVSISEGMGATVDELAGRLDALGVKSEEVGAIGAGAFRYLADECHGNLDAISVAIALYNSDVMIDEKNGKIVINDQDLEDALGELYEFDRYGNLTDKRGTVLVTHDELVDTYEHMLKMNDIDLKDHVAKVDADSGPIRDLNAEADHFLGLPANTEKTFTTNIITNHQDNYTTSHNTMATGGHLEPRHASGFIAAGPTHTRYGLVGEDGVEAVWQNDDGSTDVYPLNNPRYLGYAKPLAESIAASLAGVLGKGGDTYVINGMSVPAESELAAYMRSTFRAAIREGRA